MSSAHRTAETLTRELRTGGMDAALASCFAGGVPPHPVSYHFVNAYSLYLAARDTQYAQLLLDRAVLFPDSRPLARVLQTIDRTDMRQVRGPTFFELGVSAAAKIGLRQYFMGSSPETLAKLKDELERRIPDILIAGSDSPPFTSPNNDEFRRRDNLVLDSEADIVWLGLGTPKQDHEAVRISKSLSKPVFAVGAAFDFSAGVVPPAHPLSQRLYLEWLHRLIQEPRRLWRRYLFGNAFLLLHALYRTTRMLRVSADQPGVRRRP